MKNDVVRWSRMQHPNSNISSSNNNSTNSSSINNKQSPRCRNSEGCKSNNAHLTPHVARSLVPEISAWQQQQQQTIIECDITNFNCNLFKTSFLPQCKTQKQRSRHCLTSTATSKAAATTKTRSSRRLLLILQFSAVVFLYNFNVGFVAGNAAAAAHAAKVEAATPSVLPPYVLDYETASGNAGSGSPSKLIGASVSGEGESGSNGVGHYTHTWAVHIPNGDNGIADAVAKDHGFINLGKIFDDHYHFSHHKVSKRSLSPATDHQTRLDFDERVHWAKQQRAKSRSKRDFIRARPSRTYQRTTDSMNFNDPKWAGMWYLNRGFGLDMNVIPAWREGITGKGIVVTILDDGLESDHPDIVQNYDPKASYDVNSHDDDPMPHYDMTDSNRHGTRCAGEVAATANNSICAVGIAYGASVGGVRMLDGDVTDAVEARSLSLNPQHIDIYSASWGPDDDGKTVDGPGELASRAFIEGTTKGRKGKGSIFIWASGNGGRELDNCNCDGYTNSIWTLSISSATEEGYVPWYSEKCSSTLATTYSSGGQSEKQVVTTDLHHSCTSSHTGTSASAPLAAGIAALVLQSNQNLTWRDLQHIVVRTAKPANLKDSTWALNGVGRRVSHSFGYGLMDAAEMVRVARSWKTVPEQQRCEINAPHVDKVIPPRTHITLQLSVNHCRSVNYLEHVQAKITLTSQRRGDIQLYLRSPANTKVTLLTSRAHDNSRSGFNQWPFMSVHTWGESPHGNWQLEIHNEGRYMAQVTQWDMIFYGTDQPAQPDDQQHDNQKNNFSGSDMLHNDIEFDASDQWRNMQQVAEDRSNTAACLKWSDQKCLECNASTYYYLGLCYDQCPAHSYPSAHADDSATAGASDNRTDQSIGEGRPEVPTNELLEPENSLSEKSDSLLAEDRRRRRQSVLLAQRRICAACDKSCLRCTGPRVSECSSCYPGSQLRQLPGSNETFCYVYTVRSTGSIVDVSNTSAATGEGQSYRELAIVLLSIVAVVSLVGIGVAGKIVYQRRKEAARSNDLYTRVALIADDESDECSDEEIFTARIVNGSFHDVLAYHDEQKLHPIEDHSAPLKRWADEEKKEEVEEEEEEMEHAQFLAADCES
ncbi:furin-like protease 1 isoform X1 [Scaptodrosophila lebanonensis]|uniref:furin n=1 Tax=Drosophila lebanonensis TaxID=7225 RepID=A0A6J2TIG6_DROLE|nr:furin-like protease 1 isoform X1 [Scaptodrosophila lebanonensis]XP_030376472.1 furin-like protease 1 isoform X1 [Scaptodrosophila lebanonensis]